MDQPTAEADATAPATPGGPTPHTASPTPKTAEHDPESTAAATDSHDPEPTGVDAVAGTDVAEEHARDAAPDTEDSTATDAPPTPPAPPIDLDTILPKIEAAIFTSDRALSAGKIAEALDLPTGKPVQQGVDRLNQVYADTGRAFRIESVAGGFQVLTQPEHADVLAALHKTKGQSKLTGAAMETLAIVAYKQPVLRAELESIRGVACGETLRSLMERHLIKIVGRAEEIGRPMLYGTTKRFLEVFGLASLKDLPKLEELQNPPVPRVPPTRPDADADADHADADA